MKSKYSIPALVLTLAWGCRGVEPKMPKIQLDPESEKFYETARLIMSKEEMKIFFRLEDAASRKEFMDDFWEKRNPDPFALDNEFKRDFLARVDYVSKRFKEGGRGINSDRGRVYLFLGPPDKIEEYQNSGDPAIRGPILYWVYYRYDVGVMFADEKGYGQYKIIRTDGDLFGAMEWIKLGQVAAKDENNKAKFIDFLLKYDPQKKEILVNLPVKAFRFKESAGVASAEMDMAFYIYQINGRKVDRFQRTQLLTKPDSLDAKTVTVHLPYDLKSGEYYFDVALVGKNGTLAKSRKIFEIKF